MENIENINFGQFRALQLMMSQPTFDRPKQLELNFSNKEYTETPPGRALKLLPNLRIIDLSHNRIDRFDPRNFIKGTPLLEELYLSHNNIKTLDDLIELGTLKHLKKLNILENPVTKRLIRVRIVEFLLFPPKYQPYSPVKILTAGYTYVPNDSKTDDKRMKEINDFNRILERKLEEFEKHEIKYINVHSYSHKDALANQTLRPCPVPRKTRFPMLETLNEEFITIREVQSILISDNLDAILPKMGDKDSGKIERVNEKVHQEYLQKYMKRQNRKQDELGIKRSEFVGPHEGKDEAKEMQGLYRMDQAEIRSKQKMKAIEEKLWEKPYDLQFKDAEYNISIKDHKKMLKDYEEYKKKLKAEKARKKKMYIDKVRAASMRFKKKKMRRLEKDLSEESVVEVDKEEKKVFGVKAKNKTKFNLDLGEDCSMMNSDESSLEEGEADNNTHGSFTDMLMIGEVPGNIQGVGMSPGRGKKDGNGRNIDLRGLMAALRVKDMTDDNEMDSQEKNVNEAPSNVLASPQIFVKKPSKRGENLKIMEQENSKMEAGSKPQTARGPRSFFVTTQSVPNLGLQLYPRLDVKRESVAGQENDEKWKEIIEDQEQERSESLYERSEPAEEESQQDPEGNQLAEKNQPEQEIEVKREKSMEDRVIEDNQSQQETVPLIPSGDIQGYFSAPVDSLKPVMNYIPGLGESSVGGLRESIYTPNTKVSYMSPTSQQGTAGETDSSPNKISSGDIESNILSARSGGLMRANTAVGKGLRINIGDKLDRQPSSSSVRRTESQTGRLVKTTREISIVKSAAVPKIMNLGLVTSGTPSTMTSRQLSLRSNAQKVKQQGQKTFKISNKVFARHASESGPKTFITAPVKPMTHRPTYQPSGSKRKASLEWTEWNSTQGSPQKGNYDPVLTTVPTTVRGSLNPIHSGMQSGRLSLQVPEDSVQVHSHSQSQVPPSIVLGKRTSLGVETTETSQPVIVIHKPPAENEVKKERRPVKVHTKVVISEPLELANVLSPDKRVNLENLVPQVKDGISEKQRAEILKGKGASYTRLVETSKMLDDTTLLIQKAKEIGDKVHMVGTHKIIEDFPERIVNYDQIAEFLRQYKKVGKLKFDDNVDIRDLIYLVNDFDHLGEENLTKVSIEGKLREMKQKGIGLEGPKLEIHNHYIAKLGQYMEILENLEVYKNMGKTAKALERIDMKEIERAENNAILAAHYMKLRKHYGETFVNKYFKDSSEVLEDMEANRAGGVKVGFAHKVKPSSSANRAYNMVFGDQENVKKEEVVDMGPDWEEIKEEREPRWLNYTRVEKYQVKPMYNFEELTEMTIRKKDDEMTKTGQRFLTVEEKMIKYVQDLKDNAKKRKELKARVDKHIKEGRKDIDEFLEHYRKENPKIHDKRLCFREYVKLLWENKI